MSSSSSAKAAYVFRDALVEVASDRVSYSDDAITSEFTYESTVVEQLPGGKLRATPTAQTFSFKTQRKVPKLGVMIVGWGGNNGTTVTGGILANKLGLSWDTKEGTKKANYLGSITQASTVKLGVDSRTNEDIFVPMSRVLPLVHPNDMAVSGWDISAMPMGDAMKRACVLDVDLQRQLYPLLQEIGAPLPSVYAPTWIAANQDDRADNLIPDLELYSSLEGISRYLWSKHILPRK